MMNITYLVFIIYFMILSQSIFPSVLNKTKNYFIHLVFLSIVFSLIYVQWIHIALLMLPILLLVYTSFYNDDSLILKLKFYLGNIILYLLCVFLLWMFKTFNYETLLLFFIPFSYLYLNRIRENRDLIFYIFVFILSVMLYIVMLEMKSFEFILIVEMMLLLFVEYISARSKMQYESNTKKFQSNIMIHHYEEVKTVYLNMRGWRHDYHNHLQSLKAYLSKKQVDEAQKYLSELEEDLDRVDSLIRSGNVMIDAILNSKLSIAMNKDIDVTYTVTAPEIVSVSDIDLCIILANIFDNAIEACEKIDVKKRFIRVYVNILHNQLYISLTNSAEEDLNENQKHYISEKRGNHGHGMKRVKLTVDKYEGYLNLKNEPGVFACEIMLPLVHEN